MSHSKIIQISRRPIDRDDWKAESDYYDIGFVGSVADYVADIDDDERKACIEWLSRSDGGPIPGVIVNEKDETLKIVSKEDYFRDKWKRTTAAAKKLSEMSLDEFASGKGLRSIEDVNYFGNDKFSLYMDAPTIWDFCPIDEFMRYVTNGDTFYIGGIVDYHF